MKFLFHNVLIMMILSCNSIAQECPKDRADYFCLSTDNNLSAEMNLINFYSEPAKIMGLYNDDLKNLPHALYLDANWFSPFFGAGINLNPNDNNYHLMILGGMTRMKEMTLDAYRAIICHEIGHLLGGEPRQTISGAEFTSSEGQADFFSASQCLPKLFRSLGMTDNSLINKRVEKAGFEFMNLAVAADKSNPNRFFKRGLVSMKSVNETLLNRYPTNQCRYETYRNNTVRSSCWFKN
jgi:hypothetical protein